MSLALGLLQLAACAAVIARAGISLSASGDRLAQVHGWDRGWVGLALLATVTSLPELASGISAVALVDAPNLAVGNALGACLFNLAFLVVVDAVQWRQPLYREASRAHLLSAAFGVVMLSFVALSLVLARHAPVLLHVGLYSPLLLGLYLLALRSIHWQERSARVAAEALAAPPEQSADRRLAWRRFALAAVFVVAAGSWLPTVADGLALALGLSRSFAGTVFMALVTTLPEMAVTLAALRLRALDLAIGNLLGSTLFNLTILAVDDAFYLRGPLLADAAPVHVATAVTGSAMSALVIVGLLMRPQGRVLRLTSWISIGLASAYLLNAAAVYLAGGA